MSNNKKTFADVFLMELAIALEPLSRVDTSEKVIGLVRDLGWELPTSDLFQNGFSSITSEVETLIDNLYDIADTEDSENYLDFVLAVMDSVESVIQIITKADGLRTEIETELNDFDNFIEESGIASEKFPERLLDYLFTVYLQNRRPKIFGTLHLLGIIENEGKTAAYAWEPAPIDSTYSIRKIYWNRVPKIFSEPLSLADTIYDWNVNKEFKSDVFLSRLKILFKAFHIPSGLYKQDQSIHNHFNQGADENIELRIPLYQNGWWPDSYLETGISITSLAAVDEPSQMPKGLAVLAYFLGASKFSEGISENWQLLTKGSLNIDSGLGLLLRPPYNFKIDTGLFTEPEKNVDGLIEIELKRKLNSDDLYLILGSEGGSLLGLRETGLKLIVAHDSDGVSQELSFELNIKDLTIAINSSEGDGFIQKILSGINLKTSTDLAFGYSNLDGAYFRGSGALDITIPVHETLGPINLKSAYIGMGISDDIEILLGVSFGAEIGPVSGNVEQIGLSIPIEFSDKNKGNLGPLDVKAPSFMPPKSVGLVVATGPITGGGFLEFDPDNERYSGMLQLQFEELGLTAIGLITTRMPDGSDGYSMLISIMVEFSPPIQLSFGFTLSAVGGLVGINRTMKIGTLRDRIRNGTIDSILFPRNPIQNAQRIISDLRTVMPPEEDRFIVGPMVRIGYGSPNFITGEIAVMIELPEPVRIALLGQIAAFLPEPDETVVELHIDVLGTIEPSKQLLSIDATIYDSRILTYTLTGDMALRLKWGDNPVFAMSLGGFHPKFSPPPNFPSLRRLRLSLGSGNNPRFNCDAYHALTSNSLQFGSRLEVYAKYSGAKFQGHMGFDALFYFSPFSFEAAMSGGVAVRYKGKKLASVRMELYLSGPTPWYAEGTASFEILVWEVDVHFEKSWGPSVPAELEALNPEEKFIAALNRPESWGSTLPEGAQMVETLRSLKDETDHSENNSEPKPILIHPSGSLEVHQNVLPLDIHLDKFGNAPITGNDIYDLDVNSENGVFNVTNVDDYFARGQFQELSNNDKVSKPSYELFKNGISIKSNVLGTDVSLMEDKAIEFESDYIDEDFIAQKAEETGKVSPAILENLLKGAAAKKSPLRNLGKDKYAHERKIKKINIKEEAYKIVNTGDMTLADIDENNNSLSRSKADEILRQRQSEYEAELMIVPEYEVAV